VNGRLLGLLACLLVLPWSAPSAQCSRGTLAGEVTYVRDGDTIELCEMAIRLQGLAAPEWNEPGGTGSRDAMIALVQGRTVRCDLDQSTTGVRARTLSSVVCESPALRLAVASKAKLGALATDLAAASAVLVQALVPTC
jgi:hypothetical protein